MRLTRWLTAVVTTAAIAGCSGAGSSESCAPPVPVVSPASGAVGDSITVTVEYGSGCDDNNNSGATEPVERWTDARVTLTQAGQDVVLTQADADRDGRLSVTVKVPPQATAGPATVHTDGSDTAAFTVTP